MENKKLTTKEIIITGFALFAIFFGAGNLIIPPKMGLSAGSGWLAASAGFNLSDSILILVGILALSKNLSDSKAFGSKISPNFGRLINLLSVALVGPLLSVPRTAATTFEVGILPFMPNFNRVAFSVIFFIVVYILALNGSKVLARVGKYLTPILLIILFILIVAGIAYPAVKLPATEGNKFSIGFIEGYQTMDSLGPIFITAMVLTDLRARGITEASEIKRVTIYSGLIAVAGLIVVYTGLSFIGAKSIAFVDPDIDRTLLLITMARNYVGEFVAIVLSLVVGFACLSTAIGLTSAFAQAYEGKFSYKTYIAIGVGVSAVLSVLGVEEIMKISIPVLLFVYPIVISLYILNLLDKGGLSSFIYRFVIALVALVSFADGIRALGYDSNFYVNAFNKLPFAAIGMSFVPVLIAGLVLGYIIDKLLNKSV